MKIVSKNSFRVLRDGEYRLPLSIHAPSVPMGSSSRHRWAYGAYALKVGIDAGTPIPWYIAGTGRLLIYKNGHTTSRGQREADSFLSVYGDADLIFRADEAPLRVRRMIGVSR